MPTYLHALSTAVPEAGLTTAAASELLRSMCPDERTAKKLARLLPHSGIEKRYLAAMETQHSLDEPDGLYRRPAVQPNGPGTDARARAFDEAADRLLRRMLAPMREDKLGEAAGLITVSCTHASSPGLERAVFKNSAVPPSVDRWNLGFMGCSAALSALRLGFRSTSDGATLAVACELSSFHFQYSADLEQLTANILFADGAAGVLMGPKPSPVRVLHARSIAIPQRADQMIWWAGDHGLRLSLSPELPATLAEFLPPVLESFLADAGMRAADVDHWLVHPGGPQILDAVEAKLELSKDSLNLSRAVLRNYGNMSSPTILFVLRAAIEAGRSGKVLLMAFGPGLTIEVVLLELEPSSKETLRGEPLRMTYPVCS